MRLCTLLVCILWFSTALPAADLSGKWQVEFRTDSNTSARPLCTLRQSGNQISGACKGPHSEGPMSGSVNGQSVELTWKTGNASTRNSGDGQMQSGGGVWMFSGTLGDDGVIAGTGTAPTGEKGPFTAKRQ